MRTNPPESLALAIEVALAVAPPQDVAALASVDCRQRRKAVLDMSAFLAARLAGVVEDDVEPANAPVTQSALFDDDLGPLG